MWCKTFFVISIISCFRIEDVDRSKYDSGKTQYELLDKNSMMPLYGQCWKDAIIKLKKGCKQLSDVMQSRLALAYLNCFLKMEERTTYDCDWDQPVAQCTRNMIDVDRSSYTTFFTHTQNICYFLESQIWHEEVERTINRLASSSEEVALQIEQYSELQREMIKTQTVLLDEALNLSDVISASHKVFEEFRATSDGKRLLINDVFDKVTKLQTMILGEFSGFYSIIYYTLSIIIAYLLTSSPRTSTARFWLFGIMTFNIFAEHVILSFRSTLPDVRFILGIANASLEEQVYTYQWLCRKFCISIAVFVLVVCAYMYRDINFLNNQLLNDIKQEMSEIKKHLLFDIKQEISDIKNHLLIDIKQEMSEIKNQTLIDIKQEISEIKNHLLVDIKQEISDVKNHLLIDIKQEISDLRKIGQKSLSEELDDPLVPKIPDADSQKSDNEELDYPTVPKISDVEIDKASTSSSHERSRSRSVSRKAASIRYFLRGRKKNS